MFLSLVRPERISSPITSSAAVTCSAAVGEFAVAIDDPSAPGPTQQAIPTLPLWVMMLQVIRRGRLLPAEQVSRSRRGGPQRRFALPLERALGAPRPELGAPFPRGGRAQSRRPVPGRARRRRLAQVGLCGGATARGRAGAEFDRARALGRTAGDDSVRQRYRSRAADACR